MSTPAAPSRRVFRKAHVVSSRRLTPHSIAIVLGGEGLRTYGSNGPAAHIKLFLPPPGESEPLVPTWGPTGPVFPPDKPRPLSRTYTPRRWNPERCELEVHVMTHSGGPGAKWAEAAKPGDPVVVAGPGRPYRPIEGAAWHLIAGDETALPAIATILESLGENERAFVYIDVSDEKEEVPLETRASAQVTWLHREGRTWKVPGELLAEAIRAASLPDGLGAVWVGCEAGQMREIRKHLLYERHFQREALCTRGYWKLGEANYPDHDMGEDV